MSVQTQGVGMYTGGTDRVEMLLKQFGGEVIAEFARMFKLRGMHRVKNLKPGQKAELFPALGKTGFAYHHAGQNLLTDPGFLQSIAQGDKTIWADREAVAPIVIDKLEEKLTYWSARQEYAAALAEALAFNAEQNTIRVLARAARAYQAPAYPGAPTGDYIDPSDVGGTAGTEFTAAQLVDAFLRAQRRMDEKRVPENDRWALISPATLERLLNSAAGRDHINKDFNGNNGSIAEGTVYKLAGFTLVKSTNIPDDDHDTRENQISGVDNGGNDYRIDMETSMTRAICFQRLAVGTVVSGEIGLETEYKIELRGDLLVASYAMGHGELRPECVVEIAVEEMPAAPGA